MIGIGWTIIEHEGKRHVLPNGEVHGLYPEFLCCPTPEPDDENVIVHHSYDRREDFENGTRKPS